MRTTVSRITRATLKGHGFRVQTAPGNGERFWFHGRDAEPPGVGRLVYARAVSDGTPGGLVALYYASSKTKFATFRHPAKFWASPQ